MSHPSSLYIFTPYTSAQPHNGNKFSTKEWRLCYGHLGVINLWYKHSILTPSVVCSSPGAPWPVPPPPPPSGHWSPAAPPSQPPSCIVQILIKTYPMINFYWNWIFFHWGFTASLYRLERKTCYDFHNNDVK